MFHSGFDYSNQVSQLLIVGGETQTTNHGLATMANTGLATMDSKSNQHSYANLCSYLRPALMGKKHQFPQFVLILNKEIFSVFTK